MRVLFTSVPAPSHVEPMLPLAQAIARHHDVTFATGPALVPTIEKRGIRAVPLGIDWSEPEADQVFTELQGMPVEEISRWWVLNIFLDRAAKPFGAGVRDLLADEPADVLVRTHVEFGGWAAAEAHGVPQVIFGLGQMWDPEVLVHLQPGLEGIRDELSIDTPIDERVLYGDLMVLMHSESYSDWVPPVPWVRCRPPVTFGSQEKPPPPDVLDDAPDLPVALVTFGTVWNRTPGVFELVLEALDGLPLTAVVTVGPTRDPDSIGPVPDNVRVRRFVPYDTLIPHLDLVISHGGWGTVMAALAHGLPQVIIPVSSDQPWHAERCTALGVAEAVARTDADPTKVRAAVTKVLENDGYRERAVREQEQLRALPPPDAVVPHLERLAVNGRGPRT